MQLLQIDLCALARAARPYLLLITGLPPVMRTFLEHDGPALVDWTHDPGSCAGYSCAEERSLTRELTRLHEEAWAKFEAAGGNLSNWSLCYTVCYFADGRAPSFDYHSIVMTFWKTGGLSALCNLLRNHPGLDLFRDEVFALELLCRPAIQEHPDTAGSDDMDTLAKLLEGITVRRAAEAEAREHDQRHRVLLAREEGYL